MSSENDQFEALFNHATIGIIVTDKNGLIVNFNKLAETQFGYKKQEALGLNIDTLVPSRFRPAHQNHRNAFYKHPSPRRMGEGRDLFAQRKDGSEFPVEISLGPCEIDGDLFVFAFIIDITVRKKSEDKIVEQTLEIEKVAVEIKKLNADLEQKVENRTRMLRETLAELEKSKEELNLALEKEKELNELKSRFVTTASHEFRTPLSTILSSAFLLEKYNDASELEKRIRHIGRIKSAVGEMKGILEDFLSLSKLEEGAIKMNIIELSPSKLILEITLLIENLEMGLKQGQTIQQHEQVTENMVIDVQLLKHIITNLVQNAIKFSQENSIIEINYHTDRSGFVLTVKDHGIGISAEDRQHLFERFFRAKNALNIQGTGLGLHIIQKYLELMGGAIAIESELNKGSAFTIQIPNKMLYDKNSRD